MEQMAMYAEDIRRRLRQGLSVAAPARVIGRLARELPETGAPSDYITWKNDLSKAATALAASKEPDKDFNGLLDRCVTCHKVHAKTSIRLIEDLKR